MLLQPCDEGLKTLVAIESAAAAAPAMAVDLTLWRFLEPVSVAYWHGAWLASAGGTQIATQLQTQAATAAAKQAASVGRLLPPSFFTLSLLVGCLRRNLWGSGEYARCERIYKRIHRLFNFTGKVFISSPDLSHNITTRLTRLTTGAYRTHKKMTVVQIADKAGLQALFAKGGKAVVYLSATW